MCFFLQKLQQHNTDSVLIGVLERRIMSEKIIIHVNEPGYEVKTESKISYDKIKKEEKPKPSFNLLWIIVGIYLALIALAGLQNIGFQSPSSPTLLPSDASSPNCYPSGNQFPCP
jgi:hypothetical protein